LMLAGIRKEALLMGYILTLFYIADQPPSMDPMAGAGLLRVLRFDVRRVAFREPDLPALDRVGAAGATAVGRIDEGAVGESRPSKAAARAPIFQRTIEDHDRLAGLERIAVDTALEQPRRRGTFEAPKCFAAVLVLDVEV